MSQSSEVTRSDPGPDGTDEVPNPETGVGIGAKSEPDTFEPEENPDAAKGA